MSNEVNLEELRENARTNYGITNADDLEAEQLQSEIDAIDKQAEDAREEEAQVQRNADRADANSTAASDLGAGGAGDEDDDEDEDEDEDETPEALSKLKREDLEAKAREAGVDGDPSDKEQYPNKDALVTAIEAARANQ